MRRSGWSFVTNFALAALVGSGMACDKKEEPASAPVAAPTPTPPPPPTPPQPPPPPQRNPDDIPPPDDVKAPPADAKTTDSGLAYKVLTPGKGKQKPVLADTVEVHYTGWTTDGRMFDSSV